MFRTRPLFYFKEHKNGSGRLFRAKSGKYRRYAGIGLGRMTCTRAITGKKCAVTPGNGLAALKERIALYKKLDKADKVTIEEGNPAFEMAKETGKQAGREAVVPDSAKPAVICAPVKKTGREDTLKPARPVSVFSDGQLPGVPVPL